MPSRMNRDEMLAALPGDRWDVVVVGGGASGLGIAVDAATRGYRTLLLEQHDFAKGTSSRSTKLVHGGVRYLQQGNVSLVLEALRERGLLVRNAPHLVRELGFVVPRYKWWEGPFYGVGLKVYDALAGRLNIARSKILNREETIAAIPNVESENLLGGVRYHDAQFDDARLAFALAQTATDHGATVLNYVQVARLLKAGGGVVEGVEAIDRETGRRFTIGAKVVVNATGVFTDGVRRMDDPGASPLVTLSQGVHLVLDRAFQPSDTAIMVPHTDDGRVLFVIPWHGRVLVGTTDTAVEHADAEPRALPEEVQFILRNANRYLSKDPTESDVLSVFAGLRPLVRDPNAGSTKELARDHVVLVSGSGLVTIVGGKWTTYRKMAEDTVDHAFAVGGLEERPCVTEDLALHGAMDRDDPALPESGPMRVYGSRAAEVQPLLDADPADAAPLHPSLPYARGHVRWAARHELARTVEDALARRTRALLLDARASIEAAPRAAEILASELGRDAAWVAEQVAEYEALARGYLLA